MGNRAVIIPNRKEAKDMEKELEKVVGIYLHWNGGRDSVEAFLKYCELRGFRSPDVDNYGIARLTQVVSNFMGGDLSIGVDIANNLDCDNYNNGVYIVEGWKIVDRLYFKGVEQAEYNMLEMLIAIDNAQPKADRLGKEVIESKI